MVAVDLSRTLHPGCLPNVVGLEGVGEIVCALVHLTWGSVRLREGRKAPNLGAADLSGFVRHPFPGSSRQTRRNMRNYIRKWLGVRYNDNDYEFLRTRVALLEEEIKRRTAGLGAGEEPQQNSTLEYILGAISAFEKKLGKAKWHWEDDPRFAPPERPQRRVWEVEKLTKKKGAIK